MKCDFLNYSKIYIMVFYIQSVMSLLIIDTEILSDKVIVKLRKLDNI